MASDPHTRPNTLVHSLRLRLKPKAPPTGFLDGGWWPRSRDLGVELPELVGVLAVRLGSVTRVAYATTGWSPAPRFLDVNGHKIRLDGFESQEQVVHLSGPDRQCISLLVVPPEATGTTGHDALMSAARRDSTSRPAEILAATGALHAAFLSGLRDDAVARWELDGGRVRERA